MSKGEVILGSVIMSLFALGIEAMAVAQYGGLPW